MHAETAYSRANAGFEAVFQNDFAGWAYRRGCMRGPSVRRSVLEKMDGHVTGSLLHLSVFRTFGFTVCLSLDSQFDSHGDGLTATIRTLADYEPYDLQRF